MFKRLSERQFDKIVSPLTSAKRQTVNEKEWYRQIRLLNNRIAAAQKKGYTFSFDVIPSKPPRVTQKAIQNLASLKGAKLYARAENPINASVSEKEQNKVEKELVKQGKEKPVSTRGDSTLAVALSTQKAENLEEPTYSRDIDQPSESTVTVEPTVSDYEADNEPVDDTTTGTTDYGKDFYDRNKEYEAEYDEVIDQYRVILDNIFDELGAFEYKIESLPMYHNENFALKTDAALSISKMLNGAIEEYGEQEVARRLNEAGKEVSDIIDRALYYVYKNVGRTDELTNASLNRFRDILFKDDAEAKMKYDFRDLHDI